MRESIGSVSLLNFIIFFIFLVFAFLAATLSYYKSYRVNNAMVAAIEKFEGFNSYAQDEIDVKLLSLGYEKVDFNCPNTQNGGKLVDTSGATDNVTNANKGYSGYCVYAIYDDSVNPNEKDTDEYNSYEVVTLMTFHFPVIQDILKLKVSAKTDRIYDFEASWSGFNN